MRLTCLEKPDALSCYWPKGAGRAVRVAVAGTWAQTQRLKREKRHPGERRYGGASAALVLLVMLFAAVVSRAGSTRAGG